MPLTARFKEEYLDATSIDDATWSAIHRRKPPVKVQCRGCSTSMQAKRSKLGMRFFAHDSETVGCPSMGETAAHLNLKSQLAQAARRFGWRAELEAVPKVGDVGGWRADVLATDPLSGTRVAFEVQLAPMTVVEGEERTAKYAVDDVATFWVTTSTPWWLWRLPGFRIRSGANDDGIEFEGEASDDVKHNVESLVSVSDGLAVFREHSLKNPKRATSDVEVIWRWEKPDDATIDSTVAAVLGGELLAHPVTWLNEQIPYGVKRDDADVHVIALVTQSDIEAESQYSGGEGIYAIVRKRRGALARASYEQQTKSDAAFGVNTSPLSERQVRVLRTVYPEVRNALHDGEQVWAGLPLRPLLRGDVQGSAVGDSFNAGGVTLWIGVSVEAAQLVAVLSPVDGLITGEHAQRWLEEGVRVFVESEYEAGRVAGALGWPMEELQVRASKAP
jgi:hypothetical protein